MNIIQEFRRDADGLKVLNEWLGEGGLIVEQSLADSRAETCLTIGDYGKPCPKHSKAHWWETAKGALADGMRAMLEFKNDANIHATREKELSMCAACGCALRLKVFVPIKHIAAHTTPDVMNQLPEACWIKKEINA